MKKETITEKKRKSFLEKLSEMTDEQIQDYIKNNGKNNQNNKLFVFRWDLIDPKKINN